MCEDGRRNEWLCCRCVAASGHLLRSGVRRFAVVMVSAKCCCRCFFFSYDVVAPGAVVMVGCVAAGQVRDGTRTNDVVALTARVVAVGMVMVGEEKIRVRVSCVRWGR